jgi:hypothetical protein
MISLQSRGKAQLSMVPEARVAHPQLIGPPNTARMMPQTRAVVNGRSTSTDSSLLLLPDWQESIPSPKEAADCPRHLAIAKWRGSVSVQSARTEAAVSERQLAWRPR